MPSDKASKGGPSLPARCLAQNSPVLGCYNCMKRRITCDRTEPTCRKCVKKNLSCPGYGIRYRFNDGIAARGKLKGKSFAGPTNTRSQSEQRRTLPTLGQAQELIWVAAEQVCLRSGPEQGQGPADQIRSQCDTEHDLESNASPPSIEDAPLEVGLNACRTANAKDETEDVIELPHISPCLQLVDARTRHLFKHFADHVSPVMMLVDDYSNGYRHVVLPLAVEDPIVRRAVCVASMFHLSIQQSELRLMAESGRAAIITKLQQMAIGGNVFTTTTWTTILLLLVGELVNGSDDILTLYRMLISFIRARGPHTDSSLIASFLQQQTDLIDFFTLPIISEHDGVHKLMEDSSPSTIAPEWPNQIRLTQHVYTEAYRQARQLYLARAQADLYTFNDAHAILSVERLKTLLEVVDPDGLGAHVLVWPYFVAASEAILSEHRTFFRHRLDHIWLTTKYRNVKIAIDSLDNIWAHRHTRRWTSMLPDIGTVIM